MTTQNALAAGSRRRVMMKRFSISMSAAIVAAGLAISPAQAGRDIEAPRPNVTLERPFRTVLIANPDIVDVQTRTDRSVRLEPLNSGTTNLIFVDEQGMVITNLTIVVRSAQAI